MTTKVQNFAAPGAAMVACLALLLAGCAAVKAVEHAPTKTIPDVITIFGEGTPSFKFKPPVGTFDSPAYKEALGSALNKVAVEPDVVAAAAAVPADEKLPLQTPLCSTSDAVGTINTIGWDNTSRALEEAATTVGVSEQGKAAAHDLAVRFQPTNRTDDQKAELTGFLQVFKFIYCSNN